MKVAELVEALKTKDQNDEVEFVIIRNDGLVMAVSIKEKAKELIKLLKIFK